MDIIIYCNSNKYEYESYTTNLNNDNFKNNFNIGIAGTDIEKNHINSSYIYNDINN